MKIEIETIPHAQQRYPTAGDWYWENDTLKIKVSALSHWKYEALVAVHELIEVLLCKSDGVFQYEVDLFDKRFETERKPGDESEPGDSNFAPYRRQHCLATGIERVLASCLDVWWAEYEKELQKLP